MSNFSFSETMSFKLVIDELDFDRSSEDTNKGYFTENSIDTDLFTSNSESTLESIYTGDSSSSSQVSVDLFTEFSSSAITSDSEQTLEATTRETLSFDFDDFILQGLESGSTDSLDGLTDDLLGSTGFFSTTSSFSTSYSDPIEYGNPYSDSYYWREQQQPNSCAIVAQISVYQSLTGNYVSEYDAANYAAQQGWYDYYSGTSPANVGNILEVLGVDTYSSYGTSFYDLQNALAQGDKPIVGLDANEIWNPQYDWYGNPMEQENAGHAVWVTGIDYEYNGSIGIIINDSGHENGMASVVDYHDFMNAWSDYSNFATIADNPFT